MAAAGAAVASAAPKHDDQEAGEQTGGRGRREVLVGVLRRATAAHWVVPIRAPRVRLLMRPHDDSCDASLLGRYASGARVVAACRESRPGRIGR